MRYKIEAIGAEFNDRDIAALENRFTTQAGMGFKFHSVFQVSKPGCMGLGKPEITYLAVYVSEH